MASRNIVVKKTIHVVLNQLCSSLWACRSWSFFCLVIENHIKTLKQLDVGVLRVLVVI